MSVEEEMRLNLWKGSENECAHTHGVFHNNHTYHFHLSYHGCYIFQTNVVGG